MRLAVCALSAMLLSGCSWVNGLRDSTRVQNNVRYNNFSQYGGQYAPGQAGFAQGQHSPCMVYSPRAPIPQGCNPAQVTMGAASGGFSQQPNFGSGNYASSGYGSHADVAGQQSAKYKPRKSLRKPKLRGTLSVGLEKSISGDLFDANDLGGFNPATSYSPKTFDESSSVGSTVDGGQLVDTLYTSTVEGVSQSPITFNNAHSTPLSIKGGLEYIVTPKTTVFGNIGYGYAEGEGVEAAQITGELRREVRTRDFAGDPIALVSDVTNTGFIPNENIANFTYEFSAQERIDLEVGARHYFNPIIKNQGFKTVTPFLSAAVGATYHNAVSFDVSQNQRFLERAFESDGATADYYNVAGPTTSVEVFDSEWVPTGQLNAGVEWQVTPKTALAFESGLKFQGSRDFENGENSSTNIAIPFTVRGSYNF